MLEMPVYRVNAYYHAALRAHDIWTVKPYSSAPDQIASLMELARIDTEDDDYGDD